MEVKRKARKKKQVLSSGKSHKEVRRMNTEEMLDLIIWRSLVTFEKEFKKVKETVGNT